MTPASNPFHIFNDRSPPESKKITNLNFIFMAQGMVAHHPKIMDFAFSTKHNFRLTKINQTEKKNEKDKTLAIN